MLGIELNARDTSMDMECIEHSQNLYRFVFNQCMRKKSYEKCGKWCQSRMAKNLVGSYKQAGDVEDMSNRGDLRIQAYRVNRIVE